MKLNHIDFQVADVARATRLFVHLFNFRMTSNPDSPALAILVADDGFSLVVQKRKTAAPYPEGFHVGFLHDDTDAVFRFHERATSPEAKVHDLNVSAIIENGRGTLVYCRTPDGILLEVSCPKRRPPVTNG